MRDDKNTVSWAVFVKVRGERATHFKLFAPPAKAQSEHIIKNVAYNT